MLPEGRHSHIASSIYRGAVQIDVDQEIEPARRLAESGQLLGDFAAMLGAMVEGVEHLLPERIRPRLALEVEVRNVAAQVGVGQIRNEPSLGSIDLVHSGADRRDVRKLRGIPELSR
jgi:hypothetical protein